MGYNNILYYTSAVKEYNSVGSRVTIMLVNVVGK